MEIVYANALPAHFHLAGCLFQGESGVCLVKAQGVYSAAYVTVLNADVTGPEAVYHNVKVVEIDYSGVVRQSFFHVPFLSRGI